MGMCKLWVVESLVATFALDCSCRLYDIVVNTLHIHCVCIQTCSITANIILAGQYPVHCSSYQH